MAQCISLLALTYVRNGVRDLRAGHMLWQWRETPRPSEASKGIFMRERMFDARADLHAIFNFGSSGLAVPSPPHSP